MHRPRRGLSPATQDVLIGIGTAAYLLGFVAMIEAALWRLIY